MVHSPVWWWWCVVLYGGGDVFLVHFTESSLSVLVLCHIDGCVSGGITYVCIYICMYSETPLIQTPELRTPL